MSSDYSIRYINVTFVALESDPKMTGKVPSGVYSISCVCEGDKGEVIKQVLKQVTLLKILSEICTAEIKRMSGRDRVPPSIFSTVGQPSGSRIMSSALKVEKFQHSNTEWPFQKLPACHKSMSIRDPKKLPPPPLLLHPEERYK